MGASLHAVDQCCRDCTILCRNARTLADLMQLRDWSITVDHEHPPFDEGSLLEVVLAGERKQLRILRHRAFYELDEKGRRHALVHELIHPLLRDLYETVRQGAEHEIGGAAYRIYIRQVRLEIERATDVLASIIAPTMPELTWA